MCKSSFLDFFLCAALFLGGAPSGYGQSPFAEGDRFAAEGLYEEAVTAYLRALYERRGTPLESELDARIARCRFEAGEEERAVVYARRAINAASDERERDQRRFELAEILIAAGRYSEAGRELETLTDRLPSGASRPRLKFLLGLLDVYRHRWEYAFIHLSVYFAETETYPPDAEERVLRLLSFARRTRPPDPETARILSYIVPGAGQAYTGEFLPGLNSLLVTGGAGALVAFAVAAGDWPDAIAITWFVFLRFYLGSPYHAGRIAVEKTASRTNSIERAVLELLTE